MRVKLNSIVNIIYSTVLETVASVQHNGSSIKDIKKHSIFSRFGQSYGEVAMKADSICKTYDGTHEAVKDLTFTVKTGEVCAFGSSFGFHELKTISSPPHFSASVYLEQTGQENRQYSQCFPAKCAQHQGL